MGRVQLDGRGMSFEHRADGFLSEIGMVALLAQVQLHEMPHPAERGTAQYVRNELGPLHVGKMT